MNFRNIYFLKAFTFSIAVLFITYPTYSQDKPIKQGMIKNNQFGELFELKINEKVHFEDSLTILLTSFSHKRPYIGGPTKATAYLSLSKGDVSEEITLSVHGVEGKSESEDGLSDLERYDSMSWMEYKFQLKSLHYDESIKIIISKKM
jgi:hypothetical protein